MSTEEKRRPAQTCKGPTVDQEITGPTDTAASRKPTLAENMILTVKLLLGAGLLGFVLWAIDTWTSGK